VFTGCAADTATLDTTARDPPAEHADTPQPFYVWLRGAMTAESAVSAIVAAGHDQLAGACESAPDSSVRVLSPLASGDYADVVCSSILDGNAGQTSEALSSAERIGQAQQKGIFTTVACFAAGATVFVGTRYGICPHEKTEQIRTNCNDVGGWGSIGLGFVCGFTALFPF
jgi:hypothetical protein